MNSTLGAWRRCFEIVENMAKFLYHGLKTLSTLHTAVTMYASEEGSDAVAAAAVAAAAAAARAAATGADPVATQPLPLLQPTLKFSVAPRLRCELAAARLLPPPPPPAFGASGALDGLPYADAVIAEALRTCFPSWATAASSSPRAR